MLWRKLATRAAASVVYAVSGYVVAAGFLDVTAWKAAVMSGLYVAAEIVQKLAFAYRDGELTADEINEVFGK